jgi:AraC-like DNA-binding protein
VERGTRPRSKLTDFAAAWPDPRPTGDGPLVRNGFADLFEVGDGLSVGLTRLPRAASEWPQPMEIGADHHVVFNYVTEEVDFERVGPTLLTPNELVICPAGSIYRRRQTRSPEEVNVFLAADEDHVDLVNSKVSNATASPTIVAAPGQLSFEAWRLAHELRHIPADRHHDLEYAERATLLIALLRSTSFATTELASTSRALRRRRELVDATRQHLAHSFADASLTLDQLGLEVGAGAFHLARVFRQMTGSSLHQYRTQLRLRAVLLALVETDSLAQLAVSVGFSSHSHLSDVFRRHFDASPSQVRKALRRGVTRGNRPPSPLRVRQPSTE